jgi:hypothetical protein
MHAEYQAGHRYHASDGDFVHDEPARPGLHFYREYDRAARAALPFVITRWIRDVQLASSHWTDEQLENDHSSVHACKLMSLMGFSDLGTFLSRLL